MSPEIHNFIIVWTSIIASLFYCHFIGKSIPKGTKRLFAILPIICVFLILPLNLHTIFAGGLTYFFIVWLGTFKLLLYAFGHGPLSPNPPLSLTHFICLSCFPIKFQDNTDKKLESSNNGLNSLPKHAIKTFALATFSTVYHNKQHIHPNILLTLYSIYLYLMLETLVLCVGYITQYFLGVEIEPQFNEPYLCTSLQDFWGRRWNLMISSILRSTVYIPVLKTSSRVIGRKWAPIPAVLATFFVSGLMHELIFYYIGRKKPTWELTCFFILHGFSLAAEVVVKKCVADKRHLPRIVLGVLTLAYVLFTALWLFLPSLMKCNVDVMASTEIQAFIEFAKTLPGLLRQRSLIA